MGIDGIVNRKIKSIYAEIIEEISFAMQCRSVNSCIYSPHCGDLSEYATYEALKWLSNDFKIENILGNYKISWREKYD